MYKALTIAKYLIKKSKDDKITDLTNLKLQKILYYAQGWYLANKGNKLFNDRIEAWKLGPVVRSVYNVFSSFANQPIKMKIEDGDLLGLAEDVKGYLDKLWSVYKNMSGPELVTYTHLEKPWREAWSKRDDNDWDGEITAHSIKEYFESRLGKNG